MMSSDHTTIFMDHIREHAPGYYPGFESEQIRIQLLEKQERPSAMLYRFKVSNGVQIRSVFVKVPLRNLTKNQPKGAVFEKPLLFPKTEPIDMPRLHYSALSMIHNYISSLDKSQLGAIRVLDYLPQYKAVFTEESSDPSLRQLFLREHRFRSLFNQDELTSAFQNAGIWLRMYHAMPKEEDVKVRHQHREDYNEAITKLTDFLAKIVGDELFFNKTASIIINKGREVLPELLPLGLGHGDYAMRNILIGPNARVTVLDTFAKWRTPIYEDIGYFLIALKMPNLQVISHGLAFNSEQLLAYEHAFLKGYFEEKSIPYPPIRFFEILALLDKWSTTIAQIHQQTNFIKTIRRIKATLINQYFKRMAKKLLREIIEN
jgi:hypothetical protein